MKIDAKSFIKVSQIIEFDKKDSTYKFALIRATIDVINLYNQHVKVKSNKVEIPIGLIVERWLWYYYPFIISDTFYPQKNGEPAELVKGRNISFRKKFQKLTNGYSKFGSFEMFYNEYRKGTLPNEVNVALRELVIDIYKTVTTMPMKYIGKSETDLEYSIYTLEKGKRSVRSERIGTEVLISNFGICSIPEEYYLVLKYMGGFIGGDKSVINHWAEFVVNANKKVSIPFEDVVRVLMIKPESFRDVGDVKKYYFGLSSLKCVWSGKRLTKDNTHIDHVIPFAHYANNDIWNLLPTHKTVNSNKSDKIPSPSFIEARKAEIILYWKGLHASFGEVFEKEIRISLIPAIDFKVLGWEKLAIKGLQEKAVFLIDVRGFEPWEYNR